MNTFFLFSLLLISLSAHALIRGKAVEGVPDLVRISFSNGWVCSGVYISPSMILTAAHCLDLMSKVEKIENEKTLPVKALKLLPHPRFDHSAWHSFDVGLIETTPNPDYRGDFRLPSKNIEEEKGILMGTGRTGHGGAYERRQGKNRFAQLGNLLFFTGGKACVGPNDSGGPVVQDNVIVGIMATSFVTPCISSATAIYPHVKFIEQHSR